MSELIHLSEVEEVSMADDWFEIAGTDHFWMRWRFNLVKRLINKYYNHDEKTILEIGCGSATVMQQIEKNFRDIKIDGCDLNEFALNQNKGIKGKLMVYNIYDKNPDLINNYNMVLLLDVIEHIDDHVDFLTVATEYVKPGGLVMVNVPAYEHLFSNYDVEAGHKRRYTKKTLTQTFEAAGLEPLSTQYWGSLLYPVAMVRKAYLSNKKEEIIKTGFKPPNKLANGFLHSLRNIESAIPFKQPFGTSVIGIARKN